MPFVRIRVLPDSSQFCLLFQVALIGLVIEFLAAGFAILMDSFQWVNDLVYHMVVIQAFRHCLGPHPGSLVWLWYASKTGLIIIAVVFPS